MSRNKVILIIGALVLLYFTLPNEGIYLTIKMNAMAIAPYIMIGVIIYLLIVVNLLKKAIYKLLDNICEDNVEYVTKLLGATFDVKRMIGTVNLLNVYKKVNTEKAVSIEAKKKFYDVLRRKRIEVPLPAAGRN